MVMFLLMLMVWQKHIYQFANRQNEQREKKADAVAEDDQLPAGRCIEYLVEEIRHGGSRRISEGSDIDRIRNGYPHDKDKQKQQIDDITETDFFKTVQEKAKAARKSDEK